MKLLLQRSERRGTVERGLPRIPCGQGPPTMASAALGVDVDQVSLSMFILTPGTKATGGSLSSLCPNSVVVVVVLPLRK